MELSDSFHDCRLTGGFTIVAVDLVEGPMLDPIGRSALAQTRIIGRELHLTLLKGLSETETSVTLYHEILEAVTVAAFGAGRSAGF